jgi:hypothetical protein
MTDDGISPLRRRMIEDMTVRNFVAKTQADYIRRIRNFAIYLWRSPDTATAIYEITFWQQFKTYAMLQKTRIPQGYHLLEKSKSVEAGDLWCHQGTEHRAWLPAKLLGVTSGVNFT